jgi:hypothetical protein
VDSTNGICKTRERLEGLAQHHLRELAALAHEEAAVLKTGDDDEILAIDKRIENKIGEKERTIGALQSHRAEHGC